MKEASKKWRTKPTVGAASDGTPKLGSILQTLNSKQQEWRNRVAPSDAERFTASYRLEKCESSRVTPPFVSFTFACIYVCLHSLHIVVVALWLIANNRSQC